MRKIKFSVSLPSLFFLTKEYFSHEPPALAENLTMKVEAGHLGCDPNWSNLLKNSFDFKNGDGVAQLDFKHLFSADYCEEIYRIFTSNLNWIVRDSQKLEIPQKQIPIAGYLHELMGFIRNLLQQNIPEKDHARLILETLCIARSDGTQHQVGNRWHSDHEAYFTLLINLTGNSGPQNTTKFFHLEPDENFNYDHLANPVPCAATGQNLS